MSNFQYDKPNGSGDMTKIYHQSSDLTITIFADAFQAQRGMVAITCTGGAIDYTLSQGVHIKSSVWRDLWPSGNVADGSSETWSDTIEGGAIKIVVDNPQGALVTIEGILK